jgi:DNA-directed RNA polymerase I, II, and III subunit RPABC2
MTKKVKKEESDNEFENDIEEEDEDNLDEMSDELNEDEFENELTSQYVTDELVVDDAIIDKDNVDTEYIEDNYNIHPIASKTEYLIGDDRISSNRLTKYEMTRILGERVKQLLMGAKPMIKNYKGLSYEEIAEEELLNNMIPYKIKRPLPNGKFEIWRLDELSKEHLIHLLEN